MTENTSETKPVTMIDTSMGCVDPLSLAQARRFALRGRLEHSTASPAEAQFALDAADKQCAMALDELIAAEALGIAAQIELHEHLAADLRERLAALEAVIERDAVRAGRPAQERLKRIFVPRVQAMLQQPRRFAWFHLRRWRIWIWRASVDTGEIRP